MITRESKLLIIRRKMRLELALSKLDYSKKSIILDVGCGTHGRSVPYFLRENKIVGIDLLEPNKININYSNFNYMELDARKMEVFDDRQFDISLCIGMLEHECNNKDLIRIIKEIKRVSKHYVIIVPYRYALIEPHFRFPFFQLLPYKLQIIFTKLFNLRNLKKTVSEDYNFIRNNFRWFRTSQWKVFFKEASFYLAPPFFDVLVIIGKTK